MEWLTDLRGKTVGLDTAPRIYFIEEHPTYLPLVQPFFQAVDEGAFTAVTSTVTLLEVLVHPLRSGNVELANEYRDILLYSPNLVTVEVSVSIAEDAARIRAGHRVRTPDALLLATATGHGASHFLTNDSRLPSIPHLQLLVLDDLLRVV